MRRNGLYFVGGSDILQSVRGTDMTRSPWFQGRRSKGHGTARVTSYGLQLHGSEFPVLHISLHVYAACMGDARGILMGYARLLYWDLSTG
jgi:hypothetical protein